MSHRSESATLPQCAVIRRVRRLSVEKTGDGTQTLGDSPQRTRMPQRYSPAMTLPSTAACRRTSIRSVGSAFLRRTFLQHVISAARRAVATVHTPDCPQPSATQRSKVELTECNPETMMIPKTRACRPLFAASTCSSICSWIDQVRTNSSSRWLTVARLTGQLHGDVQLRP